MKAGSSIKKYMSIKFSRARDKEKKSNLQRGIEP